VKKPALGIVAALALSGGNAMAANICGDEELHANLVRMGKDHNLVIIDLWGDEATPLRPAPLEGGKTILSCKVKMLDNSGHERVLLYDVMELRGKELMRVTPQEPATARPGR